MTSALVELGNLNHGNSGGSMLSRADPGQRIKLM